MELYISDHPLDCLTCAANGNCELQDMAGVVGLREVRYGYDGANHFKDNEKDHSQPVFHLRARQVHRLFALRARLRRNSGNLRADHRGSRIRSQGLCQGTTVPGLGMRLLRRLCRSRAPLARYSRNRDRERAGGAQRHYDMRLLRRGLLFQSGNARQDRRSKWCAWLPDSDGQANHGHACVKGRFAWGYATHPDRVLKPMVRAQDHRPLARATWEEAIGHAASEFKRIQAKYGRDSIGGITSSRCTNEETFLVQKMVRAAFGNNNVDTCARVCHSPTGYGLKNTLGTSAGTQDFDSVEQADVIMVIGANPTDAHPVFASQMKRRLRSAHD